MPFWRWVVASSTAAIAQLGQRQTEDLKVPGSIPGLGSVVLPVCVVLCLRGSVRDVSLVVAGFVSGTMGFSCFENLARQAGFEFVCACWLVGVGLWLLLRHCGFVVGFMLGGSRDTAAVGCLTLIVIVCQCGMRTLVLVCLGLRAECNWAKSSQHAARLRFCDVCWRAPFAFVRCWGKCACPP